MRFRPIHALAVVLLAGGGLLAAQYLFEGGARRAAYARVSPGPDGRVVVDLAGLGSGDVRFYNFLNTSNQEIDFFVGRDRGGELQVGFDASETCAKRKRGFRHDGEWMVCNTCDKAFRLSEVNADNGGCSPAALRHREEAGRLVLAESDILSGWRLFH